MFSTMCIIAKKNNHISYVYEFDCCEDINLFNYSFFLTLREFKNP